MESATTEQRVGHVEDEGEQKEQRDHRVVDREHSVVARETVSKRVSRLAVEGGGGAGNNNKDADAAHGRRAGGGGAPGRTLPPPHAWLAIDDMKKHKHRDNSEPAEADQWAHLLRGGGGGGDARSMQQHRRSSFCVVRRERAAREAWLDRAWEAKRSWHQRNGGAPDADTPVVVVVGKASDSSSPESEQQQHQAAGAVGGGGVAMDVEEVRACRDLGLELPSDCTVEIQCYGISGASSPTNTAGSSGADSPCGVISSPGADPMDVKARLKVWAQAVALASTTHLGS